MIRFPLSSQCLFSLAVLCGLLHSAKSFAQGPPPGPPPLQPLTAPPAPAGNAVTTAKANLGKALFWDEQLSSTRTISCGTCHQPVSGGVDPRASLGSAISTNPGPDGTFGTADDINGSPGVILNQADGKYELDDFFGLTRQVTGRYAPSAINAGYSPALFWDGRATSRFDDPISGTVVLAAGAALESQAAGPPVSDAEMAHSSRDWSEIETRIRGTRPLALAGQVPATLESWIDERNYPELFTEAFGIAEVTAAKIIMAIATYERTLVSNQAPLDQMIAGNPNALTAQEQLGQQIFGQVRCAGCHSGNRLTDDRFHYIGVRPQSDDPGRFAVTGNNADLGRMKTPSLRNAGLRGAFMHNGRFGSLTEVVEFYNRGGDFDAPNKDRDIRPLNLTQAQKDALVAFLGRPLTDPRVAAETAPFDRPSLYADSNRQPQITGTGVAGSGGNIPQIVAMEPPLAGNPNFTVGIFGALGGADAVLVIDSIIPASGSGIPTEDDAMIRLTQTLSGSGSGNGYGSIPVAIPGDVSLDGLTLFGRWFVNDPGAVGGISETAAFELTIFGESAGLVPAPGNLSTTTAAESDDVEVSWNPVAGADHYQIYRGATDQFSAARLLGESATTGFIDNSASVGDANFYWVVAVTETEAGPASQPSSNVVLPASPQNLTASDASSASEVVVDWSPVSGAASYTIFRSTGSNPDTAVQIGTASTNQFLDTTGEAARVYNYWVSATVDGLESNRSEADTGSRSLAAPVAISATDSLHTDKVVITWTPGNEATSSNVYRATTDLFASAVPIGTTSGNTIEDTDATPLQSYFYWVVALNDPGASTESVSDAGTRALPAPTNLTVSAGANAGEAVVSWSTDGGASSFRIYRSESNEFDSAVLVGSTAATSFTDDTLEPGNSYFYWVEAANGESLALSETPAAAVAGEPQPDLAIGASRSNLAGNDVISPNGAGQRLVLTTRRLRAIKAFARLQNDGNLPASFAVSGSRGNGRFAVSYHRVSAPFENLTAAIQSGAYECESMNADQPEMLRIRIKPTRTSNRKRVYRLELEATSILSAEFADLVKVKTIQKP